METEQQTIRRSDHRVVAGVVGGIAEYFDMNRTLLRLAAVFGVVATGIVPGIAAYLAGMALMPISGRISPEEISDSAVPASR